MFFLFVRVSIESSNLETVFMFSYYINMLVVLYVLVSFCLPSGYGYDPSNPARCIKESILKIRNDMLIVT